MASNIAVSNCSHSSVVNVSLVGVITSGSLINVPKISLVLKPSSEDNAAKGFHPDRANLVSA